MTRWECPLCGQHPKDEVAHRFGHIPEVTLRRYIESFPNVSGGLLASMAFLHVLTSQHRDEKCCRTPGDAG